MVTQVTTANFSSTTLTALATPSITSITVTDNTYTATGATSVALTGGYIKIIGSSFVSGATVYVDSTPATSVAFISSTQLNVQVPGSASSSYVVYVINPDGSIAVRVNGINYSATPTWVSSNAQTSISGIINIQLIAGSDSTTTYALASGSSLPSGLTLTSGGLISGTVTGTGVVVYNFSVVATDLEMQQSTQAFTISISFNDTYFKYTTLLLNGETSVTPFISDASTNSFGLIINGDTKPTLFNPYQGDGYYSVYGGSTSDYLQVASNAVFAFPGAFTVEGWFYWPAIPAGGALVGVMAANGFQFYTDGSTYLGFNIYGSSNVCNTLSFPSRNVWHHIAMTRDGSNNCTIWVDGVSSATGTSSFSFVQGAWSIYGGSSNGGSGYISNLRVVKDTALYTTGFTPSTTPLTAVANTVLLTCQSSRFIDKSTNNFTLTVGGSPSVSPAIPFAANSSYSTYGSAYFNANGTYLTIPANLNLTLGTNNHTIECWYYAQGSQQTYATLWSYSAASAAITNQQAANNYYLTIGNGSGNLLLGNGAGGWGLNISFTSPSQNVWHHVAVVRTGNVFTVYVDGVSIGTGTYAANITAQSPYPFEIGGQITSTGNLGNSALLGYITDFRIVKGTALYTSAFTLPTSQLTAIANTQLLTLQYNGGANNQGIIDNSNFNNIVTRVGNTSQGTFSPYSQTGFSTYFNGSAGYINTASNTNNALGAGNYTIEFWCYSNSLGGSSAGSMFYADMGGYQQLIRHNGAWECYYKNGTSFASVSLSTVPLNQWVHQALVRSSGTVKWYINGIERGSASDSTNFSTTTLFQLGNYAGYIYDGYISNVRVVKGTAVYTSAFTPSTAPLTAITGTIFLTAQSNRFIDNGPFNTALTITSGPQIQAFGPFGSISEATPLSYSNYFGTKTDYLSVTATTVLTTFTSDFTFEAWVYPTDTSLSTTWGIWDSRQSGSSPNAMIFFLAALASPVTGSWRPSYYNGTQYFGTGTVLANQWTHVAWARSGTTMTFYVNGVAGGTATISGTQAGTATTNPIWIGSKDNGIAGYGTVGYISNFRIVNGTAVYTSSFTPSTAQLTAITNTVLLTCQSTRIIDNSTSAVTMTGTGTYLVKQFNPFGYTAQSAASYTPSIHGGSAYFDGTGDYLTATYNSNYNIPASTPFTVEGWAYTTATSEFHFVNRNWGYGGSGPTYAFYLVSGTTPNWSIAGTGSATYVMMSPGTAGRLGQWNHYAWTRDANNVCRIFTNGIEATGSTRTDSQALTSTSGNMFIGVSTNLASNYTNGYLSDLRFVVGNCTYTSNFVPPTQALTNYSTTYPASLLLNFTNGGIIDQHSTNVLETVGNAQLSTSVKKYNSASIYFDGTGDYLTSTSSPNYQFGTGNYTIEAWIYPTNWSSSVSNNIVNIGTYITGLMIRGQSTSGIEIYTNNAQRLNLTTGITANTWQHIALVRNGSACTFYVNGSSIGTFTDSSSIAPTAAILIIGMAAHNSSEFYTGYIDDLRITKGYARYTANFTVPTSTVQMN